MVSILSGSLLCRITVMVFDFLGHVMCSLKSRESTYLLTICCILYIDCQCEPPAFSKINKSSSVWWC